MCVYGYFGNTFCPNAFPNRLIASVLARALASIADDSPTNKINS